MLKRLRFKNTTLEELLADEALRLRGVAQNIPFGIQGEQIVGKARQAEIASQMTDWLRSPGLQAPKR